MNRVFLRILPATLALFAGILSAPSGFGRELLIAFGVDKPPYVLGHEQRGLEIDIVRKALKYRGYTVKVVHAPNKRLQMAVREMNIDGAATVRAEAGDGAYYSDAYIGFENFAITKARDGLSINSVEDLRGKSIVAWQNAYRDLGPEFEALFTPGGKGPYLAKYSEPASQRAQNLMFWIGRAQVIIVDKSIFQWYRKTLAKEADTAPDVVYHNIFPARTYYQVAFKEAAVRDDFNAGLHYLRSSGQYQLLLDKLVR